MAGTVSKPVFVKDGQYMSMIADATITLGQFVKFGTVAGHVDVCGDGELALGVAVSGNRFSRTATDGSIAAGQRVTVCTRGIVNVFTDSSAIAVGGYVTTGAAGVAKGGAVTNLLTCTALALEANGSAAATIQVKLLRG